MEVPSSRYTISDRAFVEVTGKFEYSEEFETRRLHQKTGKFRFQGACYRISEAFLDQSIGLLPTEADGIWMIYYCRFQIGHLDQHSGEITYDRRLVASRCARSNQAAEAVQPAKNK